MARTLRHPEANVSQADASADPAAYALRIAVLAFVYYVMGRLGLLLAVPPGYATVIWPPSGIALAALILYGPRLWPGIFLGSLLVNLEISGALSLEGLASAKMAVAAGIATGSTLQALFARQLVRKVLGVPIGLRGWKDVARLLTLAGPLGCLVAPTVGVSTMYVFGLLSSHDVLSNWTTWWKGDTFGMLVFLPLILIAPGGSAGLRWRNRGVNGLPVTALLVLLVPLGLTFYAWKAIVHFRHERNTAQFAALVQDAEAGLLRRVASYKGALLGGSGFFLGSDYVSRAEWRKYAEAIDIARSYPGMNGIGWIAALDAADLPAYVQRMRSEGAADFTVYPQLSTADLFIISYLEPEAVNAAAIGLNIAFEPKRRAAAIQARDTGYATLSRPVQLVQDRTHGPGFLLLMPVYETGRPLHSVEDRRAAFRGWIFAPLIVGALLNGMSNTPAHPLHMHVYDGIEHPDRLIYLSHPPGTERKSLYRERRTLNVAGQQWVLIWESTPAFEALAANYEHLLVLASGLLLTGLFAGFLMMVTRRAQIVQQLVNERTQQLQKSDEALRASEETFRSAMEHASIGMALMSPAGVFLRVNQALGDLLGYAPSELEGRTFQSLTHADDLRADLALVNETLSGARRGYQMEKRYFHKDGHVIWALLNVSLLRQAGTPQRFVVQIQDITQRRQMDRMKSEFISTVSHELRTPLTSIRGSLGLIASGALGPLPQKIESMMRIAHTNSERLVRIINDILDIDKIESGKLELHMGSVPVASFLKQALEANDAYGARFNVRFVLQAVPEDVEVKADPDRLMQVMANLLSNAAKFSAQGGQVAVRALQQGDKVRVEVEDRGTGIPEEFRSHIFEKFAQADASSSRRFEGTGLGLAITQQLVEAMGGTIGFTTEWGIGTTFHFELPCTGAAAPPAGLSEDAVMRILVCGDESATQTSGQQLHKVLHVEDDIDLSKVLSTALSGKVQVDAAPTLSEAQRKLREEQYALVVLDLQLPDGNGVSLLDVMEQLGPNRVPVVILSASEVPREIQERVAATLVKSRMSETYIVETILKLVQHPRRRWSDHLAAAK